MNPSDIRKVKLACYTSNMSMAAVANLSPLLFLTFRSIYGISYSLLGLLVLVNFMTQLGIDLIFSFFSHRFNIQKTVRLMPMLTILGLVLYGVLPVLFPQHAYLGLLLGTFVFSASSGLAEVLVSPVVAALPLPEPDREVSKLHSVYAWGVVLVITLSTLFLLVFGKENWWVLALLWTILPFFSCILFLSTPLPEMTTPKHTGAAFALLKNKALWVSVFAIFCGGSAECTMAQWSSGYLEQALGLSKVLGDIFGVALFALAMGIGRTLYTKYGKKPERLLFWGTIGSVICYLLAAISPFPIVGLIACVLNGFCVAMLWPGNLIIASERFPQGGVFIFALMAAGGDMGASLGPQLVGVVTDSVMALTHLESFAMKCGMLSGMFFPLVGILLQGKILRTVDKE